MGIPFKWVLQNFGPPKSSKNNFTTVGGKWIKFWEWVDIKNKLNLT